MHHVSFEKKTSSPQSWAQGIQLVTTAHLRMREALGGLQDLADVRARAAVVAGLGADGVERVALAQGRRLVLRLVHLPVYVLPATAAHQHLRQATILLLIGCPPWQQPPSLRRHAWTREPLRQAEDCQAEADTATALRTADLRLLG